MKSFLQLNLDSKRILGLDILRAVAILCVVIDHGGLLMPPAWREWTDLLVFDGVSIFFVLSGFLIGGILIKLIERGVGIDIIDFWKRRWYRTLPNYLFVVVLLAVLELIFNSQFDMQQIGSYALFSQNFNSIHPVFFPEAWSLSVEEWFYLLIPFFLFIQLNFFKIPTKSSLLGTALLVILVITYIRFNRYSTFPALTENIWDNVFRKQVITRLDSIMYGVLAAYVFYFNPGFWEKYKRMLFIFGLVLLGCFKYVAPLLENRVSLFQAVFSFSFQSIATACLLPFLTSVKSREGFWPKALTYISILSYSMYLLNLTLIQNWILRKIPWTLFMESKYAIGGIRYVLYWVLVFCLSHLLYFYYEAPTTRLRDR
jgi:peptidoglycan/LPS O-acetylase OafA/YrhL